MCSRALGSVKFQNIRYFSVSNWIQLLFEANPTVQYVFRMNFACYCTACIVICYSVVCCVLHCNTIYCTILHCNVFYCTVLYCYVLYCVKKQLYFSVTDYTVLHESGNLSIMFCYCITAHNKVTYCSVLYCLYCIKVYCTVLPCEMHHYSILYCSRLLYIVLNCTVWYCMVLYVSTIQYSRV